MSENPSNPTRRALCQAMCAASGLVALRALPGCGKQEAPSCSANAVGVGDAKSIAVGQALYVVAQDVFICRDSSGYYAMSAQCTHVGTDVNFISASAGFKCPLHGSTFAFDGMVTGGPALTDLPHYELCVDDSGLLIVDLSQQVTENTRLVV